MDRYFRRKGTALLLAAIVSLALARAAPPAPVPADTLPAQLALDHLPLGLDLCQLPPDNPLTDTKVRLGRRLFFDPILSADGTVACASCHQPDHAFASATRVSVGVGGRSGRRNVPSILNRAYGKAFFWDGREGSLESQALKPIEHPDEMATTVQEVIGRLERHAEYPRLFRQAFGTGVTSKNLAQALACFERVLLAGDSRVDRFRAGEVTALNADERHGLWLYESRGRCWRCHSGPNFSDEQYHNTGVSWGRAPLDLGRYEVTHRDQDRGRFKTPTLRALPRTGPYMHDGSMATLEEVVEFYNRGGGANPNLDPALGALALSKSDTADLVAFLRALDVEPTAKQTIKR